MTLLSLNDLYKDSFRIWQCKGLRKWVSLLGENSLMYSSWINSEKKKQLKPFWSWHTVEYQGYLLMSQSVSLLCKTHLLHRVLVSCSQYCLISSSSRHSVTHSVTSLIQILTHTFLQCTAHSRLPVGIHQMCSSVFTCLSYQKMFQIQILAWGEKSVMLNNFTIDSVIVSR